MVYKIIQSLERLRPGDGIFEMVEPAWAIGEALFHGGDHLAGDRVGFECLRRTNLFAAGGGEGLAVIFVEIPLAAYWVFAVH